MTLLIQDFLLVCIAYLVGSIPFGLVFGRLRGVDVRAHGSGNIGATNVGRTLGKGWGALTLAADVLKAVLPMAVAQRIAASPDPELVVSLCGGAAFLGHLFPVYLGFRGGKGVATALGVFLYLAPVAALLDLALFAAVVANWGYVSLGSLTAALFMPGIVWVVYGSGRLALLAAFFGVLIWFKHRENIVRLKRGEEKGWRKRD